MTQLVLEAIQAVSAVGAPDFSLPATSVAATPPTGFAQWVEQGVTDLNRSLLSAEQSVQQLAAGTASNLHEVMLQLEQARLAMQVASQVRSRVLEAYQEVMRMQV